MQYKERPHSVQDPSEPSEFVMIPNSGFKKQDKKMPSQVTESTQHSSQHSNQYAQSTRGQVSKSVNLLREPSS